MGSMPKWSDEDISKLKEFGLGLNDAKIQWEKVQEGNPGIELVAPCTLGNGIVKFDDTTKAEYRDFFLKETDCCEMVFFVPASGSGSRMFKEIYEYLQTGESSIAIQTLMERFYDFPFSSLSGKKKSDFHSETEFKEALKYLFGENGCNLGNMPKCLIPFHQYGDEVRTPIEEHIRMSGKILDGKPGVKMHFTIQKEHELLVKDKLKTISTFLKDFQYDLSFQDSSTDAIAFDEDGSFIDKDGKLMLRPGGHGALINNIDALQNADLIFIRNIDNVQHDDYVNKSVAVRQELAGFLLKKQAEVFEILKEIDQGKFDRALCKEWLKVNLDRTLPEGEEVEVKQWLIEKLNKPIRVCGMVKNTGLPGGGPFWVSNVRGHLSRQIIEKAQVSDNPEQNMIFEKSTHFNPVELVCTNKDFQGNSFDLKAYVDEKQYFLVEKPHKNKMVRYVERPGLWNGAMANWLTFFVEIPNAVFSPVKTFSDLLSPYHIGNT